MHSKKADQLIDSPNHFPESSTNGLVVFKTFLDKGNALELAQILESEKIPFSLVDNKQEVDLTFTGDDYQRNFQLYIRRDDFERAYLAQEKQVKDLLQQTDEDHYLFSFTNDELKDILARRDEWSTLDYLLAQKILADRGVMIDPKELKNQQNEHLDELASPTRSSSRQIIAGYILAVAGGWIGLIIGWNLWKMKKTLPNGDRVYVYPESQRYHGKIITCISLVIAPLYTFTRLYSEIENAMRSVFF